jgi:CBS domain-containing protein
MMIDLDVSAAPVIDEAGRAVGVIAVTDLLIYQRELGVPMGLRGDLAVPDAVATKLLDEYEIEIADPTRVDEVMTPDVFSVEITRPSDEVVAEMLRLRVHRLFVTDEQGAIVGVISTTDILRNLSK